MKYEIDLPPEVAHSLSLRASETGQEVVHLIQMAVAQFVADEVGRPSSGDWTEDKEARRANLIDKDIQGTITPSERAELVKLNREGNEHYDKVAPRPIEGAVRLHQQLLDHRGRK